MAEFRREKVPSLEFKKAIRAKTLVQRVQLSLDTGKRRFQKHCERKGCRGEEKDRGTYFKRTFYPLEACLLWSVTKKLGQGLLSYSFHPVSWKIVL